MIFLCMGEAGMRTGKYFGGNYGKDILYVRS